jgi:hypothetical protein
VLRNFELLFVVNNLLYNLEAALEILVLADVVPDEAQVDRNLEDVKDFLDDQSELLLLLL